MSPVADADALREAMVARLGASGVIATEPVARAMRAVPRHAFLPDVDLETAYADHAVVIRRREDGSPTSSVSQPTMVAAMLERLQVAEGHRVLEVGTGSGYNAALLCCLVGSAGTVVTVELEPGLSDRARQALAGIGEERPLLVTGDGRLGHAAGAPYDRVIVTAGASEVAAPWTDQLVEGGRIVAPIVDRTGVGSVVTFDKVGGELVPRSELPCGFLVMRDAAEG